MNILVVYRCFTIYVVTKLTSTDKQKSRNLFSKVRGVLFHTNIKNTMVSTGDTEISLHIRAPWNSREGGGGTPDQLKPKVPRSAQIIIFGGRWYTPDQHFTFIAFSSLALD